MFGGYNVQISVNSEYVVGVGIFQHRNKLGTFIPMVKNMHSFLGAIFKKIVAYSGYESEENYVCLEGKTLSPFIKPQTYDKWKKKSFKKDIIKRENMLYDEVADEYTCTMARYSKI